MASIQQTVWKAEPHTLAKIAILKNYLHAWFRILGVRRKNEVLLFVDGFAGPGRYSGGEEGSPVASVKVANSSLFDMSQGFIGDHIYCVFFEKDQPRYAELCKSIAAISLHAKLRVNHYNCEFVDGVNLLEKAHPQIFKSKGSTLVFADPFGGTGIPFSTLARCMNGTASELLINLDVDGIARIYLAHTNNNRDSQLTELFGDESWKAELTANGDMKRLSVQILTLYKKRLFSIPHVRFVWSFAMRGKHDAINYHLVFATKHPLGQEKMKEAMKAIDKSGTYSFSDAHTDQHVLFGDGDDEFYAQNLFQKFNGQTVGMDEVNVYALNETPFLNGKKMLKNLEDKQRLQVKAIQGCSRQMGKFPEDKIESVTFGNFGPLQTQDQLF